MKHFRATSHPHWAMFQAGVGAVIRRHAPDWAGPLTAAAGEFAHARAQGKPAPQGPPEHLVGQHGQLMHKCWDAARLLAEWFAARVAGDAARATQAEDELRFSDMDPEWVVTLWDYVAHRVGPGHATPFPYIQYESMDDFVVPIPRNATVALVGDWGTGTAVAQGVMEQIRRKRPDVVIHLGDVYFAGTPEEMQANFMAVLDKSLERPRSGIRVYNLPGNHDMYSGGEGYYGLLPHLNPAEPYGQAAAQKASYFALRSGSWQLLAMDTSRNDRNLLGILDDVTFLDPREEEWHEQKVRSWSDQGGRTVLLSHHAPFGAFHAIGKYMQRPAPDRAVNPNLVATLSRLQGAGAIAAWFWGHVHNLEVYAPYAGLERGRCIGHGAIPVLVDDLPYEPLPGIEQPPALVDDPAKPGQGLRLGTDGLVYDNGYVILHLDDDARRVRAEYYVRTREHEPIFVEEF